MKQINSEQLITLCACFVAKGVPAEVYIRASSPDLGNTSTIDYDVGIDIDLEPIREGE